MDDDEAIILILAFVAAAHQLICSYSLLFDDHQRVCIALKSNTV
jgi:hypothetical protein